MSGPAYHKVRDAQATVPSGCPVDHEFTPYSAKYVANPYAWLGQVREGQPLF